MEYPTDRPQYFAVHYIKWLMDSGAVQEVGPDALAMLAAVVMREDDTRYQRAVNFFNEQLADRCGIVSVHALIRARQRAVDAGLLNYEPATKRSPGRYFVTGFHAQSARNVEGIDENAVRKTHGKRKESGRNPQPSIPNPIPNPNTHGGAFEKLWNAYPARNGKKLEKPKAEVEFAKLKADEIPQVMLAVAELSKSGQIPKDCFRWLRNWREWLPDEPIKPAKPKLVGIGKALFEDMEVNHDRQMG